MSKLFVSNFPKSYSEDNINLIFSPLGRIRSIRLVSETRTFAIVEFETFEQSMNAMNVLKGKMLYGCNEPLHVEVAFDRNRRTVVSGVPLDLDKDLLTSFFGHYGQIENITSCSDPRTVYIDFKDQVDAEKFLELDKKISLGDKENKLSIKPFAKKENKRAMDNPDRSIFIYNLSSSTTKTDLIESFAKFGEISSLGVLNGGKGFINYEREVSALKAIRHMDGKRICGGRIRVTLKSIKKRQMT